MEVSREALDYLAKSEAGNNANLYPKPDLILLDINMPAMNGWEFLEQYKKMNVTESTIVGMLTTSLFPDCKLKADHMPEIAGFEHKPITAEKVAKILEKYFSNALAI